MNSEKNKLLEETYHKYLDFSLIDFNLDELDKIIDKEIMAYGTAIDKKILSAADYRELVIRQREQSKSFDEMSYTIIPVNRKILPDENTALFIDEIILKMIINNESNDFFVRLTTVLEFKDEKWVVTHLHGSTADHIEGENDPWHIEEWKKKNEELEELIAITTADLVSKNRELKIEAALEKVRTIAMGMREPADMLDVCKTISLQLQNLGIKEIRNVQTAIFNEPRGTYMNYEYYAKHKKSLVTETTYTNNEIHQEFATKMMQGKDEVFITHIKGEDVADWITYQKSTNVFIDKYLEKALSLSYYWFSLGPVALGISTYHPLSEEEIKLFNRFLAVFELAYRRYNDIKLAETQAREAQIEVCLERVRSRTMAMQNSEELKEVIQVIYEQFVNLDILVEHSGFIMDYKARDDMHIWLADQNGPLSEITIPFFDSPHWNSYNEAKEKGMDFFANQLNFAEKNKFYNDLFKYIPGLPAEVRDFYLNCPGLAISTVLLDNVGLYIENFSGIPYSDEENNTLMRFGNVFQQTYTRFLDLQKAEVQLRESQVEASLERVRTKAMAMHKSDDLTSTVATVFSELDRLGFKTVRCGIGIFNDRSRNVNVWTASPNGNSDLAYLSGDEVLSGHPLLEGIYESWQNQVDYSYVLKGKDLKDYYKLVANSNLPVSGPEADSEMATQYYYCTFFPAGGLFAFGEQEFNSEARLLMKRFADVFHLTFTRHLDLKQAEAQNKIIQAENDRKTKELEEARALQLAMLPKKLPELPNHELAVYMKTATEVGGDYYDFCFSEDGSLNICLGDATGHGMKAGIMVSAMKSIFTTNAPKMDIEQFISYANTGIKSMNLKRMMMGFIMININKNMFRIINAGMPPIFLYRKKFDAVDEIIVHGMPIGAMNHSQYTVTDLSLNKNDVILLLSDGMPELQNNQNEMYGYEKIRAGFNKVAKHTPQEIINYLKNESLDWLNGLDHEDDVTFVVLKAK